MLGKMARNIPWITPDTEISTTPDLGRGTISVDILVYRFYFANVPRRTTVIMTHLGRRVPVDGGKALSGIY